MNYTPYSFSKINTFFNCPKQFDYNYVTKIPIDDDYSDPKFYRRGRFMHAYIADRLRGGKGYIKGKSYTSLSVEDKLSMIKNADESLSNEYIEMTYEFDTHGIEKSIKLDMELLPTDDDPVINGFIDYFAVHDDFGVIVDWKSGKFKDSPSYDQLELYAVWLLESYPNILEVDLVFYYTEHNKFIMKTISSNEIIIFKNNLLSSIDTIENTTIFEPQPSKQCIYCKFFSTCSEEYGFII